MHPRPTPGRTGYIFSKNVCIEYLTEKPLLGQKCQAWKTFFVSLTTLKSDLWISRGASLRFYSAVKLERKVWLNVHDTDMIPMWHGCSYVPFAVARLWKITQRLTQKFSDPYHLSATSKCIVTRLFFNNPSIMFFIICPDHQQYGKWPRFFSGWGARRQDWSPVCTNPLVKPLQSRKNEASFILGWHGSNLRGGNKDCFK